MALFCKCKDDVEQIKAKIRDLEGMFNKIELHFNSLRGLINRKMGSSAQMQEGDFDMGAYLQKYYGLQLPQVPIESDKNPDE